MKKILKEISDNFALLSHTQTNNIEKCVNVILNSLENGNKVMFCGNGGSAADSQHLAAELVGRYKLDRDPIAAIALTTDTSTITAIANDYSFEDIFLRQIKALGKKNDILYAISTSGNSKNILNAIKQAKEQNIISIGLTGESGGEMKNLCDEIIQVPAKSPDRIQEMHIAIGQIICEIIENHFSKNTNSSN
tara:strand:- start:400 stop:975 length:576 start_codon:yes stop_codon:yes gene_type:complete